MLNALDPNLRSLLSPDIRVYGKSVNITGTYNMPQSQQMLSISRIIPAAIPLA